MRKMVISNVLMALVSLSSCSSEQSLVQPVRMDNLQNTGCKYALSATESKSEFYTEEMDKAPTLKIEVDAEGIASVNVVDLKENCAVKEIRPQIKAEGNEITIVLFPFSADPSIEADCICSYDVKFNLVNLVKGQYYLKVYRSNVYGKYDASKPAYEGKVSFSPNSSFEFDLK